MLVPAGTKQFPGQLAPPSRSTTEAPGLLASKTKGSTESIHALSQHSAGKTTTIRQATSSFVTQQGHLTRNKTGQTSNQLALSTSSKTNGNLIAKIGAHQQSHHLS